MHDDALYDLLDDGEVVEKDSWRWGHIQIVKVVIDDVPHLLEARIHHSEGMQDIRDLGEAHEVEVVTRKWVLK